MIFKNISDITWSVLRYMAEKYNQALKYAKECKRNETLEEIGEIMRKMQKLDEDCAVEAKNAVDQEIQAYIPIFIDIGVNTDKELELCGENLPEKRSRNDWEENQENKCNLSIPEKIEINYEIKSCKNRKSTYYRLKNEKFIQMLKQQRRKIKNEDEHGKSSQISSSGTPVMSYIEKKHEFSSSLIIPSNDSSLFKVTKSDNFFSTPSSQKFFDVDNKSNGSSKSPNDLDSNPANTPASQNNAYPDLNDVAIIMDSPSPKLPEFKSSPSFSEGSFVSKNFFCPRKSSDPDQSIKNPEKSKEVKFSSPKFEINPFHSRNSSDQSTIDTNPLFSSFITSGRKFSDILYADEEMTNTPSQSFISGSSNRSVFGKSSNSNFPPFLNQNK